MISLCNDVEIAVGISAGTSAASLLGQKGAHLLLEFCPPLRDHGCIKKCCRCGQLLHGGCACGPYTYSSVDYELINAEL